MTDEPLGNPAVISARAIAIRDRWFVKISKGRVQTAWSLAGATLFMPEMDHKFDTALKGLLLRNKHFVVVSVRAEFLL